jgi:hypothetical protein
VDRDELGELDQSGEVSPGEELRRSEGRSWDEIR